MVCTQMLMMICSFLEEMKTKYSFSVIFLALKEVYRQKRYFFLTFLVAVVLFVANPLLLNYKIFVSGFSFPLAYYLVVGSPATMTVPSFLTLIVISLLAGMVFSLSVFLLQRQIVTDATIGMGGIILGLLAPACPACAMGLLGIVGLGGLFVFLPWKGLELSIVAVGLLLLSIFLLSRKVETKICVIQK